MDADTLLGQLQADLIAIEAVALAGGANLALPVPTCPGWTVADGVRFQATDTGDTWTLGEGAPVVTVVADAQDLYLGLWKRLDLLDVSRIDGDRAALQRALALALTP